MKNRRRSCAPAHSWGPFRDSERSLRPFSPHAEHSLALAYANSYHVGMSSLGFQRTYELVYDTDMQVVEGYRVRAMPTSYFIGPDGTIVDAHFGFLSHADMLEKVEGMLVASG